MGGLAGDLWHFLPQEISTGVRVLLGVPAGGLPLFQVLARRTTFAFGSDLVGRAQVAEGVEVFLDVAGALRVRPHAADDGLAVGLDVQSRRLL